jgi:hypothetical protein
VCKFSGQHWVRRKDASGGNANNEREKKRDDQESFVHGGWFPWNLSLRRAPTSPESAVNAHHFFAVYNVSVGLGANAQRTNGDVGYGTDN